MEREGRGRGRWRERGQIDGEMERERAKRLVCIQGIERAEATTHSQSQFSTNQIKRGISPT